MGVALAETVSGPTRAPGLTVAFKSADSRETQPTPEPFVYWPRHVVHPVVAD